MCKCRETLTPQNEFRNFGFTNARGHRAWFMSEYRAGDGRNDQAAGQMENS